MRRQDLHNRQDRIDDWRREAVDGDASSERGYVHAADNNHGGGRPDSQVILAHVYTGLRQPNA